MKLSISVLGLLLISALGLSGCGGDGTDSNTGNGSVPVTEDAVPTISVQPSDVSTAIGGSAVFRVEATGGSLAYQWYGGSRGVFNAIPSARTATYSASSLRATDNGSLYYVVVTNARGAVRSNVAKINIDTSIVMPEITTQPTSVSASAGEDVALTVEATGGGLSYQWYKESMMITGATGATLSLAKVTASDAAAYHVVISNKVGAINSATVTVVVR